MSDYYESKGCCLICNHGYEGCWCEECRCHDCRWYKLDYHDYDGIQHGHCIYNEELKKIREEIQYQIRKQVEEMHQYQLRKQEEEMKKRRELYKSKKTHYISLENDFTNANIEYYLNNYNFEKNCWDEEEEN